jgi:hypothetical protein
MIDFDWFGFMVFNASKQHILIIPINQLFFSSRFPTPVSALPIVNNLNKKNQFYTYLVNKILI